MKKSNSIVHNESGATIVYVAIILGVLVMFTALAIDVGHLYGVRNELQNAADAGALAGASVLFDDSDSSLNRDAALAEGARIAIANKTGNQQITEKTVEIGHWSFSSNTFTPSDATEQIPWQGSSAVALDLNVAFINAVRVKTDRSDTPSFFARIFGYDKFFVSNDAVAYIGFPGDLDPGQVDQPIALCQDAITKDDLSLDCNMGRMLNSGGNAGTAMTAMWTNYTQNPCSTASASDMKDLTDNCSGGNPGELDDRVGMGTQNGVQDTVFANITDCWLAAADSDGDGVPDKPWPLRLPIVKCGVDNTCSPYTGIAVVEVLWIIHRNDPQMNDVPTEMEGWDEGCTTTATREDRLTCWKNFVDNFNLQNVTGPPVGDPDYEEMYQMKNIFFRPTCTKQKPTGKGGGHPYNVYADIPKLVE